MQKISIFLIFLGLLSGCATKYSPPVSGKLATVTYRVAPGTNDFHIFLFNDYKCENASIIESIDESEELQDITVSFEADKKVINTFTSVSNDSSSVYFHYTTVDFIPEEGKRYAIELKGRDKIYFNLLGREEGYEELQLNTPEKVCIH